MRSVASPRARHGIYDTYYIYYVLGLRNRNRTEQNVFVVQNTMKFESDSSIPRTGSAAQMEAHPHGGGRPHGKVRLGVLVGRSTLVIERNPPTPKPPVLRVVGPPEHAVFTPYPSHTPWATPRGPTRRKHRKACVRRRVAFQRLGGRCAECGTGPLQDALCPKLAIRPSIF